MVSARRHRFIVVGELVFENGRPTITELDKNICVSISDATGNQPLTTCIRNGVDVLR
jgi:hypothetical protein